MSRWKSGDHVVLREVWDGRIWTARPAIVVEDSPEVIALFLANGSQWKRPFDAQGMPKRIPAGDWTLGDDLWNNDVVRVSPPGERFSILPFRDEGGAFHFWYLNIETPLERSSLGFDYMDQTLDIIIDANLRGWRWKDEEELAEAVSQAVYSREQADGIRRGGEGALERFFSRKPPFDRDWENWRPDPEWMVPQLFGDWETVPQT
jgi:hypothetical protein